MTANEVSESKSPPKSTRTELHDALAMDPSAAAQPFTAAPTSATLPASVAQDAAHPDSMWQAAMHQMMNSPSHFQRVMQAFTNAQPYNIPSDPTASLGVPGPSPPVTSSAQQLTYPALAYAAQSQPQSYPGIPAASSNPNAVHDPLSVAPAGLPGPQDAALLNNSERLNRAYNDASAINADMDALQSNIHTLIRDMGFDPNNPSFPHVRTPDSTSLPTGSSLGSGGPSDQEPWSFDSWLSQVNSTGLPDLVYPASPGRAGEPAGEDFSAFLDIPAFDTAPPSGTAPAPAPMPVPGSAPPGLVSPSGMKRKLDVVDVPEASPGEAPSTKKKR